MYILTTYRETDIWFDVYNNLHSHPQCTCSYAKPAIYLIPSKSLLIMISISLIKESTRYTDLNINIDMK